MADQWYVKVSGKRAGPLSWERLKALAKKGQFSPDDLVSQEGTGPWVPAGQVKGLFGEGGSPGRGSEGSSVRVGKPLKAPGEQPEAKPLPTATPISEPKPAGKAKSVAPRVAKPLGEPPAEAAARRSPANAAEVSPAQPPAAAGELRGPPELPDFGATPSGPSLNAFDLVIDSHAAGVGGRRRSGARRPQERGRKNTIIAAAFALMFLAVLVVGASLTRSRGGKAKPTPPSDAAAVEAAAAGEGRRAEEPEVPDIESVDGLDDLEKLDIFGSTSGKRGPSGSDRKPALSGNKIKRSQESPGKK